MLNSLAGEFISKSLSVLADNGRFLEIGKSGLLSAEEALRLGRGIRYFVIDWTEQMQSDPGMIRGIMQKMVQDVEASTYQPLPHRCFAMSDIVEAFRFMQKSKQIGKIVVRQIVDESNRVTIRPEASYLIVGGLRGLGWQTAQWLVRMGAKHLALMGRTPPSPEISDEIRALEKSGVRVLVLQGNVGKESDLRDALVQIHRSMPPLRGIVQSAGVLDDGALVNLNWSRFQKVLESKAVGSWLLHMLTREQPLDFFVMYSSVASLFGSKGQGNHAAANAFMDGLAYFRRSQGYPALSINWGIWAEIGAAKEHGVVERSSAEGLGVIATEEGLLLLEKLIQFSPAQVGVSPMNWNQFLKRYGNEVPTFFSLIDVEPALSSEFRKTNGWKLPCTTSKFCTTARNDTARPQVHRLGEYGARPDGKGTRAGKSERGKRAHPAQ